MNINVKKENNNYYLVVKNYKRNIHRCKIIPSWDDSLACDKIVDYNLLENKFDLYNNSLNLLDFSIELQPIINQNDYYKVLIYTDDGNEYPFYIDINKFYNLKSDEKVYFYQLDDNEITLESSPDKKYDFYLLGNFDDVHKTKLLQIVNDKYILFSVMNNNEYISEIYYLVITLNERKIAKYNFPIIKSEKIEFVTGIEDYGQYLKYTVSPKYNYSFLKELSIKNNEKTLIKKTKNKSNQVFIKNISFYLPNPGYNNFSNFIISYKTQENYIGSELNENNVLVSKNIYSQKEISIKNFKSEYDFEKDIYKIKWDNIYLEKLNYKITFDDNYVFYTNENFINIIDIKEKNNIKPKFKIKIECDVYNDFYTLYETTIDNFYFIDSPINFKPVIDYSEALKEESKTAVIRWTAPQYKYKSRIKIEVNFIKAFLDEYLEPWSNEKILDKLGKDFDEKYPDYLKQIAYDFDTTGDYKYKTPNDSAVSNVNKLDFIDLGEKNNYEIPLWFCQDDTKYKITVEIYDRWNILRGTNSIEFSINAKVSELTTEDIWFDRNQYMQFGETGTIGTFYKKENATPIDVKYAYAPQYKTYKGQPLYDYSNIDNHKNSLYYYLNSNEQDKDVIVKFKRSYNFYKLTYEVFYGKKNIIPQTEVFPQGNSFDSNKFTISKKQLQEEGEYTMNIRTFSSTNQESIAREIKFYVFNDKPVTPVLEINSEDYSLDENEKIIINKKYFSMDIVNNEINKKYAGWNYKEAHFFFRKNDSSYNEYPDYVIQASKETGIISFKNTLAIENSLYECKVICYDYAGNASDPYIFDFNLISHMSAIPEVLFTNKLTKPIKWEIKKSQDSEGYFWQFKYSSDGLNYEYTDPIKVDSAYHVNDPNTNQYETISLFWLQDKVTHVVKEGYYQLVIYEWNYKHPNGATEYKFESPIVEVNEVSNPSNPINSKPIPNKVAVFNEKSFNEYSYTNDLNNLIFETIHNEIVLDDDSTEEKEGQYYKLKMIEPSNNNEYECVLPSPTEIGMYTFDKIADKCKIVNQTEGVWELRFITVDKAGNDNAYKGYYTYYINLVKRNPKITSIALTNKNGSEYFGLNSTDLGMYVATNCYDDISNFKEHKEKFFINRYQINFLSTPLNSQYTISVIKNDKGVIKIMDPLTENEKRNHSKDGRYLINIKAVDPLNRNSDWVEKIFYIDTQIDSDLFFLTPDLFFNRTVSLIASVSSQAENIYYKIIGNEDISKEDYTTWNKVKIKETTYNGSTFLGCTFSDLTFDTDGRKTIAYVIEELSGNVTDFLYYNFLIDSSVKFAPIFDYDNKVYYTVNDKEIFISWNLSSDNITNYSIKLDKIELMQNGEVAIVKSYDLSVNGDGILVPVGPNENHYVDWGTKKEVSFLIKENNFLVDGLYRLTVKSTSKYGDLETNDYKFQLSTASMINISDVINKNTITVDSNRISWSHIITAMYYEISYDNKTFFKTTNNYFIVDAEKLITDDNGNKCLYMRWRGKSGLLSETSKIILNVMMKKLQTPEVTFLNHSTITDDNKSLEWIVNVSDPEISKYIYYSFDNEKWNVVNVKGKTNLISDNTNNIPLEDKEYSIFVRTTDEHPINSIYYSKSELAYAYVNVFSKPIEKPNLLDLNSGETINEPKQLFISNKMHNVDYYIYLNNRLVYEGYEINSSTLKRFNIKIKAKKRGIDKIYDLITEQDDFHIWSLTSEKYVLSIKDEKINCYIDTSDNYIEVFSMPEKKENQIILYRDKDLKNEEWNILRVGDRLSLMKQWEFHITTFDIL